MGFEKSIDSDYETIIVPLLQLLADSRADYSCFFRLLNSFSTLETKFKSQIDYSNNTIDEKKSPILFLLVAGHSNFVNEFPNHPVSKEEIVQSWTEWAKLYRDRLLLELEPGNSDSKFDSCRCKRMNLVNPKYSLKSWIMSEICDSADESLKSVSKIKQAIRILIDDIWGTQSDFSIEDRRVSNAWSRPCYDKPSNQFNLNCP